LECGNEQKPQSPTVEVAEVTQKDVPVISEWVGTLDGMVNAILRAQETRSKEVGKVPLELILSDGSTFPHRGEVAFADRQVDVRTGTIRVATVFPNPQNLLRPLTLTLSSKGRREITFDNTDENLGRFYYGKDYKGNWKRDSGFARQPDRGGRCLAG
jgi:hypothetical protein